MIAHCPKIQVRDVHKSFARKQVLKGVNLEVEAGESLVILGGSGSGKSVLLKCIIGLMHPSRGSIKVDNHETVGVNRRGRESFMRKFGMLFQGGALFDSMSVWENIAFALLNGKGVARDEARETAIKKLASVGLGADVADLFPSELSGGMQKRVSLARAICLNPEIIFFDEPTTGLDPIMADVINDLIVKCSKELGSTALTITHDMASARKIADKVAMLYQGEIIWCGPVDKLDDSGNAYVDQFIHGRAEGPIKMVV